MGGGLRAGARPVSHWAMLLSLVVMWGSAFTVTKIAVAALPPSTIVAARLIIAAVVLALIVAATRRRLPRGRRSWGFFLAMAVVGNALPFYLITWGQQAIDSGLAGILMAVMPLGTILLAHFFVEGEALNRAKLGGFLLGFAGIVVLMGPTALLELRGTGTALLAQLAVLGGALCYATNAIVARRRPNEADALTASACVLTIASLLMLVPGQAGMAALPARIPPLAAVAVLVLGLFGTALPTLVFFHLVAAAGPSFLALINYLIPLWAVAAGMLVLGERPSLRALVALALILCGIALAELLGRARSGTPPRTADESTLSATRAANKRRMSSPGGYPAAHSMLNDESDARGIHPGPDIGKQDRVMQTTSAPRSIEARAPAPGARGPDVSIDAPRAFLGPNASYYDECWRWMDWTDRRTSWNSSAALSLGVWFAYRRMYPIALLNLAWLITAVALGLAGFPVLILLAVQVLLSIAQGAFANTLYLRHFHRRAGNAHRMHDDHAVREQALIRAGGTSRIGVAAIVVAFALALSWLITMAGDEIKIVWY